MLITKKLIFAPAFVALLLSACQSKTIYKMAEIQDKRIEYDVYIPSPRITFFVNDKIHVIEVSTSQFKLANKGENLCLEMDNGLIFEDYEVVDKSFCK